MSKMLAVKYYLKLNYYKKRDAKRFDSLVYYSQLGELLFLHLKAVHYIYMHALCKDIIVK